MRWFRKHSQHGETLGLNLRPGDDHYRAFVGPPADYDLISAMTVNLLTCLGLRQHHSVLDVGCGSLRVARMLIPYLNVGKYTGIEPNSWLIDDGIKREVGADQVTIKKPYFYISQSLVGLPARVRYDFAFAQSIFSHCGPDLLARWLGEVSERLTDSGVFAATYLIGEQDCDQSGWIYPDCVCYRTRTVEQIASAAGLRFLLLDWKHPSQAWALFYKPGFDVSWIPEGHVSWNAMMTKGAASSTIF